ncbi:MAG: RNA-binding protein [Burkholderiaceae bacterium]|nr:RNA-binding protein [Burkholderiaceae bacterium]
MARLWINNLPPDATEDEVAGLLEKYGFPPFDSLAPVPGERLAAVLTFDTVDEDLLRRLQPRLHGVYFREHVLNVQVAPPPRAEPR